MLLKGIWIKDNWIREGTYNVKHFRDKHFTYPTAIYYYVKAYCEDPFKVLFIWKMGMLHNFIVTSHYIIFYKNHFLKQHSSAYTKIQ